MTDKARIKIAALVTALFLATISTLGLALHQHAPAIAGTTTAAPAAVQQPTAAPGTQVSGRGEQEGDERPTRSASNDGRSDPTHPAGAQARLPGPEPAHRRGRGHHLGIRDLGGPLLQRHQPARRRRRATPAPAAQAGPASASRAARNGARSGHHPHVMNAADRA